MGSLRYGTLGVPGAPQVAVSKSATLTKFEPTFLELEKNLVHKNFILSSTPRPLQHVINKSKIAPLEFLEMAF